MGADAHAIQRAVIGLTAVVAAVAHGAVDAVVLVAGMFHILTSGFRVVLIVCRRAKNMLTDWSNQKNF